MVGRWGAACIAMVPYKAKRHLQFGNGLFDRLTERSTQRRICLRLLHIVRLG